MKPTSICWDMSIQRTVYTGRLSAPRNLTKNTTRDEMYGVDWLLSGRCFRPIHWFEDEEENALTITKDRYLEVIRRMRESMRDRGLDINNYYFQQDDASSHTAHNVVAWLQTHFGNRLISRTTTVEWSPKSPDLKPPHFHVWGYLKDRVYADAPQTIQRLKENITRETRAILYDMCARVLDNFKRRVAACIVNNGHHFEHIPIVLTNIKFKKNSFYLNTNHH